MSELYHAKFKKKNNNGESDHDNPFSSNNNNNPFATVQNVGKKFKNTADRIESSSNYQKVKMAQKTGITKSSNDPSFTSKVGSSVFKVGSNVRAKTNQFTGVAKFKKNNSEPTVRTGEHSLDDNPPKRFRKKLNATKLKEIVGPRNSRFNENDENENTAENKRAQQYRYADWTPTVMPTSPGGKRQRKYNGR